MKTYLSILITLISFRGYGQFPMANNFSYINDIITFNDIVSDGNCGNFILGFNKTSNELFLTHLNNSNDTLWTSLLNFTPYLISTFGNIAKGDDGIYFFTGKNTLPPFSSKFYNFVGKLDFNGNLIWVKRIEGNFYNLTSLKVINNKLYCALPGSNSDTLKLYKFDNYGNEIWKMAFTSQPQFALPSINTIQEDSIGNLNIIGNLTHYANLSNIGSFIMKLDSTGDILSSSRIHGISNTEFYILEGAHDNFDGNVYTVNHGFSVTSKHYIRMQKINTTNGILFSKLYHIDDSLSILNSNFLFDNQNKLIITGRIYKINKPDKSFQFEIDTNLNFLSAIQYSSLSDSLGITLSKAIVNCNTIASLGNISKGDKSSGYIIKKENLLDSICFQSSLSVYDSLVFDTIENITITAHTTNSWSDINAAHGHLQLTKNNCSLIDGINNISGSENYFTLYPNPSENKVYISGITKNTQIEIYTSTGQLKCNFSKLDSNEIDISSFTNGFYIYSITDFERNIKSVGKLIKQ